MKEKDLLFHFLPFKKGAEKWTKKNEGIPYPFPYPKYGLRVKAYEDFGYCTSYISRPPWMENKDSIYFIKFLT